ncbi:MAG: helix-turn-helix transcriptional regulator [Clostridia bacterium]|nr:helix-turn-helix transcriptional regulator [Clostridia bacterium]
MQLGETIYRLRTGRGMSQGDLADALEVSRQSVSKWETGGAIPDLDKLVKMSALFGVTLDELVKGETPAAETPPQPEPQVIYVERQESPTPRRKIAGFALFGLAVLVVLLCTILGGFLGGVLFSLPFWACGAICFIFKERVGLWCSWTVFFLVDVYLVIATGYASSSFFGTIRHTLYGYLRFGIAQIVVICLFALLVALSLLTVRSFRDKRLELSSPVKRRQMLRAAALLLLEVIPWAVSFCGQRYAVDGQTIYTVARIGQVVGIVTHWAKLVLLLRLAIDLLAIRRWKKAQDEQ